MAYLDYIVVPARGIDLGLDHLDIILETVEKENLKLHPKKCSLLQKELQFLGHIVSKEGIRTDPQKLDKVLNWPRPNAVTQVKGFLGLCQYYVNFCPNFAELADPLYRLTEKSKAKTFQWTKEAELAFSKLKTVITTPPLLCYPISTQEPIEKIELPLNQLVILDCDASLTAFGITLSQVQNGQERVIADHSKIFSKEERNYCATRREIKAVCIGFKKFEPHLLLKKFALRVDNSSIKWLQTSKNPEQQLFRWLAVIQGFDFQIFHRPGNSMEIAIRCLVDLAMYIVSIVRGEKNTLQKISTSIRTA